MMNYLGQLRLYSFIDLIVLLIATNATPYEFLGVIFLHVGFLAFLETRHKHSYRKRVPEYLWVILALVGTLLYGHIEGILFVLFSYLYTLKTKKLFAMFSPIMRGLQCMFLVAGIIGYSHSLTWVVFGLVVIRNLCGDLRDVVKDKEENLKTLPVVLGFHKNIKYVHLIFIFVTTFTWFQYTNLPQWPLLPIFLIQLLTYNLTPR